MELEIRHLRVVCAIQDAGSLTRAASALGVSQPALTAQLQRIERMLGGEVFWRTSRGAELTALGEFVVARATPILPLVAEIQQSVAAVRDASATGPTTLRYTAAPGPLGVGLIAQLLDDLPGTRIDTRTGHATAVTLDLLRTGQQDLGYVIEYLPHRTERPLGVVEHVVAVEPAFVLLPAHHLLARRSEVALADLRHETWTLPAYADEGAAAGLYRACSEHGFVPTIGHESTPEVAVELIAHELGVGLSRATFDPPPGVVARPLSGAPLRLQHVLLWCRDSGVDRIAASLRGAAGRAWAGAVGRAPAYLRWRAEHPGNTSVGGRADVVGPAALSG